MVKLLGISAVVMISLALYVLQLVGDKSALQGELSRAESNYRMQAAITKQVEVENLNAMRGIERAQIEKNESASKTAKLQRDLKKMQANNKCLNAPVPVAVVERLRERVAAANATAKSGPLATTDANSNP